MCADPNDPAPPPPPVWARRKLVFGGGLLAVTFFLPVYGDGHWGSPLSIVKDIPPLFLSNTAKRGFAADPMAWSWHVTGIYMCTWNYAAPHLLGFTVALTALLAWRMRPSLATRILAVVTAASAALVTLLFSLFTELNYDEEVFPVLVACWCVVAYLLLSAKHARSPAEQTGWLAVASALPTAGWLLFQVDLSAGKQLGYYLAAAGTLLLLTGGLWTVRACRRATTTR